MTFFNTEEQRQILTEAHHGLQGQAPAGPLNAEAWPRELAPATWPTWDFNIMLPSYTGLELELRDLPTCPKLQQLSRSQGKP
jgi:hypothetical protein